ncbi:MAG: type II secretion system major pseudopilin GspG [Pseudomonadota bacterium]
MKSPILPGRPRTPGFTLVEVLVVVIILGILAVTVVPRIVGKPEEARRIKARADIASLETALRLFKMDNGFYPSTEQSLEALIRKPTLGSIPTRWKEGGYLEKSVLPKDPWGNDFVYLSPGKYNQEFDLFSLGRDGQIGGEGPDADVTNWEDDDVKK